MSQSRNNRSIILVDYYEGAYGPTIRIDVQAVTSLIKVKDLFLQLAESVTQTVNFTETDLVIASGLNQLIMKVVPDDQVCEKKLELLVNRSMSIIFYWSMPSGGWRRCAGLMDGLLESHYPGHQYLTQEGVDDAIVEIAFMEC